MKEGKWFICFQCSACILQQQLEIESQNKSFLCSYQGQCLLSMPFCDILTFIFFPCKTNNSKWLFKGMVFIPSDSKVWHLTFMKNRYIFCHETRELLTGNNLTKPIKKESSWIFLISSSAIHISLRYQKGLVMCVLLRSPLCVFCKHTQMNQRRKPGQLGNLYILFSSLSWGEMKQKRDIMFFPPS